MFPLGHSSLPAGEVANSSFPACCLWARTRYTGDWNAAYYKTIVCWGLMLKCFCLKSCFFCLIGMISDLTNHSLLEIVRFAFCAGPNQASRSWKDWLARAGGRHFLILRLSRCCGLFWSFSWWWGWWWWALEGDERSLVCCGDFFLVHHENSEYQFELLPGNLTKMFPTLSPAWQVRQKEEWHQHEQLTRSQAILISDTFQEPSIDNLFLDQSLVFSSWTLIENGC